MKILKKNAGLVVMYLVIFFSVALALQAAAGKEGSDSYQSKSIEIDRKSTRLNSSHRR